MQKIFSQILRESLKRKDGVYILSGSGFNADYHNIEVWKDRETVKKNWESNIANREIPWNFPYHRKFEKE